MSACTFFGHRECYELDGMVLRNAILDLIDRGVDVFYVGNQGGFDGMVYSCLKQLRMDHPYIRVAVVLAYPPKEKQKYENLEDTMYPEIEGHPKFAIDRRNRWMVNASDYCLCYVNHNWGGAHKFACLAKRRGLSVQNLGIACL